MAVLCYQFPDTNTEFKSSLIISTASIIKYLLLYSSVRLLREKVHINEGYIRLVYKDINICKR